MIETALFRMANRLAGGDLVAILRERRARSQSLEHIARELYAEFGVEVTRQTVATWCDELGIEAPVKEAAS